VSSGTEKVEAQGGNQTLFEFVENLTGKGKEENREKLDL
jgi:hypothetical protein